MSSDREAERIAVGTDDGVTIYDAMSGDAIGQIERTDLRAVYISPINQLFVGTLGGELAVRPRHARAHPRLRRNTGIAQEIYTDAAGALLVARSGAGDLNMFDVATGEQIGSTISVPEGEANGDVPRADGRELFSVAATRWARCTGTSTRNTGSAPPVGSLAATSPRRSGSPTSVRSAPYRATCPEYTVDQ